MPGQFVYMWKYDVKDDNLDEFIKLYGSAGAWVQLFKQAEGYLKTELFQDVSDPNTFITVDYWISQTHRDHFFEQFKTEFINLDKYCEKLTDKEINIGAFHFTIN